MSDLATLRERLAEVADLSRAAGVLGWEQRVSFEHLVKMMYEADLAEESAGIERG